MKKNVGNGDAVLRFLLAIVLVYVGLFLLGGIRGDLLGILVALVSLIPILTALSRKCPLFSLFNISTISKKSRE